MSLAPPGSVAQDDFSAGVVRVAPHLIPRNGAYRLTNYLLNNDGSAYKRSGTAARTSVWDVAGLTFVWDGFLAAGHRTVVATAAHLGVLAADDATIVALPGAGVLKPRRPAVLHGILFLGGIAYGGSRRTAIYNAGTVSIGEGETTIVGVGTAFGANIDAGMIVQIGDRLVAVAAVSDDTHLEISSPWPVAGVSGQAYTAMPVAPLPSAYHPDAVHFVAGGRLFAIAGDKAYFSAIDDPGAWDPTDFHRVPAGVAITGGVGIEDTAYLFTTGGVFAAQNVSYDLTDAFGDVQQRLDQLNEDMILWDAAGLATWENAIVAPCIDGVWLLQKGSSPRLLSRSIMPLYQAHVTDGRQTGLAAIYNGHYLLPILSDTNTVDFLVCRVDRPVGNRSLGTIFPWTQFAGAGARVRALAVRVSEPSREPELFGAAISGQLVDFGEFVPDGRAHDHDGSVPVPDYVGRDFATGPGNANVVKKLSARYELASTATATLAASYGDNTPPPASSLPLWDGVVWGAFTWPLEPDEQAFVALTGAAPESNGDAPYNWRVNKRRRYFRPRIRCTDPCERFVLRAVELVVRPSGRMS